MGTKSYDLFISYRAENLILAEELYKRLTEEGFLVWFDKVRLNPGCNWHAEIEIGCEASRIILPVLTPVWKESEWTKFETYGAEFIIPLLYEGNYEDVVPLPLHEYQFIDFRQPNEENWNKLFACVRHYLSQAPPEKTRRLNFVPYAHNPYFVGRERELLDTHEKVCRAPSTALTQGVAHAVSGLGGVGKTTLAREYAEKFWRLYHDILWVRGDRPLALEFQRLAEELGLIQEMSQDPGDDARRAMQELSSRKRRLLIIDNALDEESIQEWVPVTGHCRTIITSRFTGWSAAVQNVQVEVLKPDPAREFLLRRSGLPHFKENQTDADGVAKELGYLPLALEHAAAFVREASISFGEYLAYYAEAKSRRDLLARRVLGSTQYPESIATTWLVTIDRLGPLARSILSLTSFLASDDIPRSALTEASDFLEGGMVEIEPTNNQDDTKTNAYVVDRALADLKRFSMISLYQNSLSVHRLVQAVQRDGMNQSTAKLWTECAVRAINNVFPDVDFSNWEMCNRLVPHVQSLVKSIERYSLESEESASMTNLAGYYLGERARYAEAEPLLKLSLEIYEKSAGSSHISITNSLNNLALLYHVQDRYAEAELLYIRSLGIRETVLGPYHHATATSLNNLSGLYCSQGRNAEAEPLLKRSLAIYELVLGPEHPRTAGSLCNLAELYVRQGKYTKAEPLFKRALKIHENALSPHHPDIAKTLNSLADNYRRQGKYAEAEPLLKRALKIHENALGPHHPDVANTLNNLADNYHTQGKYAEAEPLYKRALDIHENAFGPHHLEVANTLDSLAENYRTQGKYAEAEPLYKRALDIHEKALGPHHVITNHIINNLALLYIAQQRYIEAEPLSKRALAICESVLGPEHPNTARVLDNLTGLYASQDKYAEAEPFSKRSLEIYEKVLGPEHPDTATSLNNLASLYYSQERYEEAEPLFKRALAIREKALGPEHPNTGAGLNNLASLYYSQGKYEEAEPLFKRVVEIFDKTYGEEHPDTIASLNNLAEIYYLQGMYEEAELLYERALAILEKALGSEHPSVAQSLNNLAALYASQGKYEEAEPLLERALAILEKALGAEHPYIAAVFENYASLLRKMDKESEAEKLEARASAIRKRYSPA